MVVTPPAAAASEALASVSRYSVPGSPVNTRMSMRPGMRVRPWQSMMAVPEPMLSRVTLGPAPRMHHQGIFLGVGELLFVETEEAVIFARRWHEGASHPLKLEPQHHHDIGAGQPLGHGTVNLDT